MPIDTRHPRDIRQDIRRGKLAGITAGLGQNYVQANLAVLPKEQAYDFLLFCQRNPRPCPLIEVTDVGSAEPVGVAPGADLRTDIPRYRVYKDGVLADEVTDATPYWRAGLLGVRRHASGRRARVAATVHDHAQPGAHVHHRPAELRAGGDLMRCGFCLRAISPFASSSARRSASRSIRESAPSSS